MLSSDGHAEQSETVRLDSPSLLCGIGEGGSPTLEEIQAFVDDPKNHRPLAVELPVGLAAAKASIFIPDDNPLTRAKIELGRQLYFDRRLSSDASVSCADCHDPGFGYAKDTRFGVGVDGQEGNRNSPTAYNRILSRAQFWDGRADTLEAQAVGPIANPIEMANTHDDAVKTLASIPGYTIQFDKIFGRAVNIEDVGRALASFERTVVTGPTAYDYYEPLKAFEEAFAEDLEDLDSLKEDDPELYAQYIELKSAADAKPLSEAARRGRDLFFSEASNCSACHAGTNFTDEQYHNIGVGMEAAEPDLGRYLQTRDEKDRGAFKTPTLRNIAQTAPYMHDGSQKTLEEVVEWYAKGGHPNQWLSDKIKPLKLNDQDKADLVAFMQALTGDLPKVERGKLPK